MTSAARAVLDPVLVHDDHLLPLNCRLVLLAHRVPDDEVVRVVVHEFALKDPAMQFQFRLNGIALVYDNTAKTKVRRSNPVVVTTMPSNSLKG